MRQGRKIEKVDDVMKELVGGIIKTMRSSKKPVIPFKILKGYCQYFLPEPATLDMPSSAFSSQRELGNLIPKDVCRFLERSGLVKSPLYISSLKLAKGPSLMELNPPAAKCAGSFGISQLFRKLRHYLW